MANYFEIGELKLSSRLFLGSSGYSSPEELKNALKKSGASLVTMGVKRIVGNHHPCNERKFRVNGEFDFQ